MSNVDTSFLADQVADQEALLSFVITALRSSEDFEAFKKAVNENLDAVKLNPTVDVDAYLDTFTEGYVVLFRTAHKGPDDYLRDDDGLPIVFQYTDVVPSSVKMTKVIDLEKRYAERHAEGK